MELLQSLLLTISIINVLIYQSFFYKGFSSKIKKVLKLGEYCSHRRNVFLVNNQEQKQMKIC